MSEMSYMEKIVIARKKGLNMRGISAGPNCQMIG
jgi:hypothetical protein